MSELTDERLAELRRIAEAATKGPWVRYIPEGSSFPFVESRGPVKRHICKLNIDDGINRHDGDYIATFDPSTTLAMLEEIKRLRRVLESVRNLCAGSLKASIGSIDSHHKVMVPVGMVDEMNAALSSEPENPYAALRPGLAWFAAKMEGKLRQNDHKEHWRSMSTEDLISLLFDEFTELQRAFDDFVLSAGEGEKSPIIDEAVDVANFAMMIADSVAMEAEVSERKQSSERDS